MRHISENDCKIMAYHEAGHAVVGVFLPAAGGVEKVTIASGRISGYTVIPKKAIRGLLTSKSVKEIIAVLLAGMAGEKIATDDVSNGSQSDIKMANSLARQMVERFGMGERFGLRCSRRFLSSESLAIVDEDVYDILEASYKIAFRVLAEHRPEFMGVAERLMEGKTLRRKELQSLVGAEAPIRQ